MARVLITGMSGAGKSTLLAELRRRGHPTIDTDYDGWTLADGTWDEPRLAARLADAEDLIVSGTVANQGRLYARFHHVVLLSAPLEVLLARVCERPGNPYGHSAGDREQIRADLRDVEPLLRRGASCELDGRRPVTALADAIEALEPRPPRA